MILEINNVSKSYKNFDLKNISFSLPRGYIMGFIGANGSGKTTTIKLIMNLVKRDSGNIKVFGMDNIKDEIAIKEKIGFVYDNCFYYEYLKLKDIKNIIAPFYKDFSDKKFKDYITTFNLNENQKLRELSQGNKMKFSAALALSHNAELLIMDEPTSGLDPIFRDEFLNILKEVILDENKSILFSTHITTDLDKIADYITLIDKGEIILSDVKDDLLENHKIIKGDYSTLKDLQKEVLIGLRKSDFGFNALINNNNLSLFKGDDFIKEKPNLEDIMLYMTRR